MRTPLCTIDSSCVIALDHLGLLPQLSFLFSAVLVPKAVRDELFGRRATRDRLRLLFDTYAFLQRCDGYDSGTVYFLLTERSRQGSQDRGEVEAVVQAAERGAVVIVDDPWGRELAERDGLAAHGTFWVLQQFHGLRLLPAAALRDCFVSLRGYEIRLPWELVDDCLRSIGQQPL